MNAPPVRPENVESVPRPSTVREKNLSGYIFSVSAGLVGACFTVIGLFNVMGPSTAPRGNVDDLVAIDAGAFMCSCLLAYLALRTREERRWTQLERVADLLFLTGLCGMVLIGSLVAFDII